MTVIATLIITKTNETNILHYFCAVSVRLSGAPCGQRPPPRPDDRTNSRNSSNGCQPSPAASLPQRPWQWARRPKRPPTRGCALLRRAATSALSALPKTRRTPRACAARPAANSSRRPPGFRESWPLNPSAVGRLQTASKPLSAPTEKGKTETSRLLEITKLTGGCLKEIFESWWQVC